MEGSRDMHGRVSQGDGVKGRGQLGWHLEKRCGPKGQELGDMITHRWEEKEGQVREGFLDPREEWGSQECISQT